jgi:hypothetical protein
MKILTQDVSRDFQESQAIARAQIAAHHYGCFTAFSPVFTRLLTGLAKRKLIAARHP